MPKTLRQRIKKGFMPAEGFNNYVLYQSIEIRAGISILDVGQPNFLVSLYITLDRQSSLLLFLSASPHLWQLETMLQWRMPVTQLQSCVIIFLSYPDKFFGKSKGQYCSSPPSFIYEG